MTDRKSKNTKKQISLGHTITDYSNPLKSSHMQNTTSSNIKSEVKQKCNTNIFNKRIKFKYHCGVGYFTILLWTADRY
jgi:hypothetical protein